MTKLRSCLFFKSIFPNLLKKMSLSNKPTKFTWVFEDFTSGAMPNIARLSPEFFLPENINKLPQVPIKIGCCPSYKCSFFNINYTYVYLYVNRKEVSFRYRLSLLNENGEKCETQEGKASFSYHNLFSGIHLFESTYIRSPANGLLVNDNLTIYCEVEEIRNDTNSIDSDAITLSHLTKMSEDYQTLLEEGKLCDLVLVLGEKELRVHKLILSTRSPVFAAMFSHENTKEVQENRVEITDVDGDVMELLVRYIYTGKIDSLDRFALELLAASDKYQLDHLKTVCVDYLSLNLTIDSVVNIFLVADLHQADELKAKCVQYITENGKQVIQTKGWKMLSNSRAELVMQLYESVFTK